MKQNHTASKRIETNRQFSKPFIDRWIVDLIRLFQESKKARNFLFADNRHAFTEKDHYLRLQPTNTYIQAKHSSRIHSGFQFASYKNISNFWNFLKTVFYSIVRTWSTLLLTHSRSNDHLQNPAMFKEFCRLSTFQTVLLKFENREKEFKKFWIFHRKWAICADQLQLFGKVHSNTNILIQKKLHKQMIAYAQALFMAFEHSKTVFV